MSSSASRTRSNITSYLIFAPSQQQKHKLKILPRGQRQPGQASPWEIFHLLHVAVQSGKWQRADCLAVFILFFPPCVLPPQQTLKMFSLCQIKEESTLLGLFTPSHPIAQSFPPPFLMKASPTRWTLNLNAEKRRRKVLRKDAGQVITLSSSAVTSVVAKGPHGGLQCHLHHFTAAWCHLCSCRP